MSDSRDLEQFAHVSCCVEGAFVEGAAPSSEALEVVAGFTSSDELAIMM